ncbi:hypothetical protein BB14905_14295 [Bacillus sp. B14905]|nr:hypothetical protein BB14905_14295 [Bacillus sp. B14905]
MFDHPPFNDKGFKFFITIQFKFFLTIHLGLIQFHQNKRNVQNALSFIRQLALVASFILSIFM